ncbi:MAG: sulfotransferase domain-containing protein, partial [Ekhidna sp.]|nr:sulfotransferase domain-containing protein [Ekhidna sp.]
MLKKELVILPNLIIAGPPKSGTTSIYEWLSNHPQSLASKVKETNYFLDRVGDNNRNANFIDHGLSRYSTFFEKYNGEKVVFESTPGYIFSTTAIRELSQLNPKIVLIFRDPAERLYSEFTFHCYKTKFFKGSFSDYVGWDGETFSGIYFERGKVTTLTNEWADQFGENVFVFKFDSLKQPKLFMKRLCQVLDISDSFYENFDFTRKNETFGLKNRKLHLMALKIQSYTPKWIRKPLIPIYYSFNKSKIPSKTPEEIDLIKRLKSAYINETLAN